MSVKNKSTWWHKYVGKILYASTRFKGVPDPLMRVWRIVTNIIMWNQIKALPKTWTKSDLNLLLRLPLPVRLLFVCKVYVLPDFDQKQGYKNNLRNAIPVMFLSQQGLGMTRDVMGEPVLMRFPSRYLDQRGFSLCELTEHVSALFDVISLLPVTQRKSFLCIVSNANYSK